MKEDRKRVKVIVWVAEQGCYSQRYIAGIFATAEAAMAAMPGSEWLRDEIDGEVYWRNNFDWEQAVSIEPFEVQEGPDAV